MNDDLSVRLRRLQESIAEAAERAGRRDSVQLVAVSKTVAAERVMEAYDAGQRHFGENRVQEALAKIEASAASAADIEWHLIGHLQTNKVRPAAEHFQLIESVDSLRLAEALNRTGEAREVAVDVLLEVNVGGEASKSGFSIEGYWAEIGGVLALPYLRVRGLMTVAPLALHPDEVRPVFAALREMRDRTAELFQRPDIDQLSMGMSGDYREAIREGATMVRIGRALFGERPSLAQGRP